MIDKVIIPKDKSKPTRIILNVYPWEFDLEKYLKDDRSWYRILKTNKEKTQIDECQVEFFP